MKKAVAILCIAVAGLAAYAYKISGELNETKEIKAEEILGLIERQEMYTKLETEIEPLPEPTGTQQDDILERIEMLRQHIPFKPSPEWIREVITAAETEIKTLRGNP